MDSYDIKLDTEMILQELPFAAAICEEYKIKFRNSIAKELKLYKRSSNKYDFPIATRKQLSNIRENKAWIVSLGDKCNNRNVIAYNNGLRIVIIDVDFCNRITEVQRSMINEKYDYLMGTLMNSFLNGVYELSMLFKNVTCRTDVMPVAPSMTVLRFADLLKYVYALVYDEEPQISFNEATAELYLNTSDLMCSLGLILSDTKDLNDVSIEFERNKNKLDILISGVTRLTFPLIEGIDISYARMWVRKSNYLIGIIFAIFAILLNSSKNRLLTLKKQILISPSLIRK